MLFLATTLQGPVASHDVTGQIQVHFRAKVIAQVTPIVFPPNFAPKRPHDSVHFPPYLQFGLSDLDERNVYPYISRHAGSNGALTFELSPS